MSKELFIIIFSNNYDSLKIIENRGNNQSQMNRPLSNKTLSVRELEAWITWASRNHKMPPALIKAVIRVESNFNPVATSPKGAQGLMQLMPGIAEQLQIAKPYDPQENIWAGTRYLGILLKKFHNNPPMALATYNVGPERVERCRGIPPIDETRGFVRDVGIIFYSTVLSKA
jgi:soluble lytic murein transglycosylase